MTEQEEEVVVEPQVEQVAVEPQPEVEVQPEVVEQPVQQAEPQPEEEPLVILDDVPEQSTQPSVDFSKLFGADIKSEDEAKKYLDSLKTEVESTKKAYEEVFANDTVKALNKYMKDGGTSEKEFLDTKYAQQQLQTAIEQIRVLDPLEALKHDLKTTYGLSQEDIDTYLANKTEVELKIEGNKLKSSYINALNTDLEKSRQQEAEMLQRLENKQKMFVERVQTHIKDLPKAIGGVQVSDKDRQHLGKVLSSPNEVIRQYFPLDKDGLPTQKYVETVYKLQKYESLVAAVQNKVKSAKAEGAKEVFNSLHNVPKQEAVPTNKGGQRELSEAEKILKAIQASAQGNRNYD